MCLITQNEYLRCGHLELHERKEKCSIKRWGIAALITTFNQDHMLGCTEYVFKRYSIKAPCAMCKARGMEFHGPLFPKSYAQKRKWHVKPAHLLLESDKQPQPPRRSAPPAQRHAVSPLPRQAPPARPHPQDYHTPCYVAPPDVIRAERRALPTTSHNPQQIVTPNSARRGIISTDRQARPSTGHGPEQAIIPNSAQRNRNNSAPPVTYKPLPAPEAPRALHPAHRADPWSHMPSSETYYERNRDEGSGSARSKKANLDILSPQPRRVAKSVQQQHYDPSHGLKIPLIEQHHPLPSSEVPSLRRLSSSSRKEKVKSGLQRSQSVDHHTRPLTQKVSSTPSRKHSLQKHGGGAATKDFLETVFSSHRTKRIDLPVQEAPRHKVHVNSGNDISPLYGTIDCNNCGHCKMCRSKRLWHPSRQNSQNTPHKSKAKESSCGACDRKEPYYIHSKAEPDIEDAEEFWNISLGIPEAASTLQPHVQADSRKDRCERCKLQTAVVKTRAPTPPRGSLVLPPAAQGPGSFHLCEDCFDSYIEEQVSQGSEKRGGDDNDCWGCGKCFLCRNNRAEHERRQEHDQQRRIK